MIARYRSAIHSGHVGDALWEDIPMLSKHGLLLLLDASHVQHDLEYQMCYLVKDPDGPLLMAPRQEVKDLLFQLVGSQVHALNSNSMAALRDEILRALASY